MDCRFKDQTLGVHEQVTLSSLDLLASVVSALVPSHAGALDRLAVHHASARLGIALLAHPQSTAQSGVYLFPGAVYAPSPEVVVDGLPRREVVGKQAPGAPATHDDVEDGLEDLARGVEPGSSWGFGDRDVGLYVGPLGIG